MVASIASAQELEKAQKLMGAKKYDAALKSLESAAKKSGLDRDSYLTILELKGLAEAQSGKDKLSEATFKQLLSIDPKRSLVGKYSGKPMVAIGAAQTYVLNNGALEAVALEPTTEGGMVKQLNVAVKNDGLSLAKMVRFHVRGDSGVWKASESPILNAAASTAASGASVDYWVEVLGDKNAQLLLLGIPTKPVKAVAAPEKPIQVAVKEPVKEVVVESVKTDVPKAAMKIDEATTKIDEAKVVVSDESKASSPIRPIGYGLMAAGVVAVGVGAYFGITANGARESIKADLAAGSATQQQLYDRDQQAISSSTIANVLFAAGGALAVTGGVLWFVGGDEPAKVAVLPSLNGVLVSGNF
jgi:hypothetical protein